MKEPLASKYFNNFWLWNALITEICVDRKNKTSEVTWNKLTFAAGRAFVA